VLTLPRFSTISLKILDPNLKLCFKPSCHRLVPGLSQPD
jgi:hypothetical protein